MESNFKIFSTKPKILAKIKMKESKVFSIEVFVNDEFSHIAIMELREFLKETNRFNGTSHIVNVYNMNGKKIDQTTLYII